MNFEIEGLNELLTRLNSLGEQADEIKEKALKAGAEIIRDEIERNTPVSNRRGDHAKDHIVVGEMKDDAVEIGPDKKHFYLKYAELGTSKQPAQGFMERSFNSAKGEAQSKVAEVIREELGL